MFATLSLHELISMLAGGVLLRGSPHQNHFLKSYPQLKSSWHNDDLWQFYDDFMTILCPVSHRNPRKIENHHEKKWYLLEVEILPSIFKSYPQAILKVIHKKKWLKT